MINNCGLESSKLQLDCNERKTNDERGAAGLQISGFKLVWETWELQRIYDTEKKTWYYILETEKS